MTQTTCEPGHSAFQTTRPLSSKAFEHTESLEAELAPEFRERRESGHTRAETGTGRET